MSGSLVEITCKKCMQVYTLAGMSVINNQHFVLMCIYVLYFRPTIFVVKWAKLVFASKLLANWLGC